MAPLLATVAALFAIAAGTATASLLPPQIHTVAGGGACAGAPLTLASGQACDGISAISTPIAGPQWLSPIPAGGYLFVDSGDDLVREVSASGVVTTVAGTVTTSPYATGTFVGSTVDGADGSIATDWGLDDPVSVAALADGGFLITEEAGCRVRMVSPGGPGVATITTIAGFPPGEGGCTSPSFPYSPSGTANAMSLNYPADAEPTADGGVLIADQYNHAIRYVSATGTMTTIAGGPPTTVAGAPAADSDLCDDGGPGAGCDGIAAGNVALDLPDSVSPIADGSGAYLVAENGGDAIREISGESPFATFSTVAGSPGNPGYSGDGGAATGAQLDQPGQVTSLAGGGFLIADTGNEIVREVSPSGTISTIAGDGFASFSAAPVAATSASLDAPASVAPLSNGNILIADKDNNRIREVTIPSVSTFSVAPSSPTGRDGWYLSYPVVTVTANEQASVQCELDPTQAPTVYGEVQPGCPYTGIGASVTTNGSNTIYAASKNSFGDLENPVSLSLNVDTTPPTVTCNGDPTFSFGDATAQVTGTLSDSVSGPASEPLSGSAPTSSVGPQTAPISGSNNAGMSGSASCPYYVMPLTLDPTPVVADTFRPSAKFSTLASLVVREIPAAATVEVTCTGKGCPFQVRRDLTTKPCPRCRRHQPAARMVTLTPLFRRAQLHVGARIAVAIDEDGTVGRYVQLTVRAKKRPRYSAVCLPPGASEPGTPCLPARTAARVANASGVTARRSKSTRAALLADPPKCLKKAGLGHIRTLKGGGWQGTIGEEPATKLNDSLFVQGPYGSVKATTAAARKATLVEIAYPGGLFLVTAKQKSYLQVEASLTATCLAQLTETGRYRF